MIKWLILSISLLLAACSDSSGNGMVIPIGVPDAGPVPTACGTAGAICSPEDLYNIRNNLTGRYTLLNDIDMVSLAEWAPIGTKKAPFSGSLNGNGYKIINFMYLNTDMNSVGIFGYISCGGIYNLKVELAPAGLTGNNYVAGISGRIADGVIADSSVTGTINGKNEVGGIVGEASNSTLMRVFTKGNITSSALAGGIAGKMTDSTIANAHSEMDVVSKNNAGGIVGEAVDSDILNTYSSASVRGNDTASTRIGGIAGHAMNSELSSNIALNYELHGIRGVNRIVGESYGNASKDNYAIDIPIWGTQDLGEHGITISKQAAMTKKTYADIYWEFGSNASAPWKIDENTSYPKLYFTE